MTWCSFSRGTYSADWKAITTLYLTSTLHILGNDSFRYVSEVVGERDAELEFETEIDGIIVNGVDIIRWNNYGKIIEIKVMVAFTLPAMSASYISAKKNRPRDYCGRLSSEDDEDFTNPLNNP